MGDPSPILLIANFAHRLGGGEESLLALARGIDRHRFAPHVLVPGEGEIADALRRTGIPVAIVPLPLVRPWTLLASLRALGRLRSLLSDWGIKLVHAHGSRVALYAALAARRGQIPVIWHVRIVNRDPLLDTLLLFLSSRVIAISEAVRARFEASRYAARVSVVYNGVDPADWVPPDRPPSSAAGPVLLLVGRLMPAKGQAVLLRAAPAVLERFPTARFVLLGQCADGERDRLQRLAHRLGVGGAVEMRDWMADPRPAFQDADVVVLPSRSEGFGRVLVEAACLAKPVVASRVGGIPEVVVDGETGILVPPEDPPALAEALIRLLGDPALRARLGAAARQRALARFTVRHHVAGVEAVYREVLEAGRTRAFSSGEPSRVGCDDRAE